MKGCKRTTRNNQRLPNSTNFNEWNDPEYQSVLNKTISIRKQKPLEGDVNDEIKEETEMHESISSRTFLEVEQLRSQIKKGYAILTKREIRSIKLPFYESLLLNLKEDGYTGTYEFINDLIQLDDEYHTLIQNDRSLKDRPFIKFDKDALSILCKGLMEAEVARKNGEGEKEIKSLLTLALHFSSNENMSWHWLAEELFEQSVSFEGYQNIELSLQAISKYLYANFLLTSKFDLESSKFYVEESMELSEGMFWHASEITGGACDLLYFESCILLHKILLEMANNVSDENSEFAIQLCRNALHWAKTVNDKRAEASALLRLISIYLSNEILAPVFDLLESYMKICVDLDDVEGLCEGYIMKVSYYEAMEDEGLVVKNMQELLNIAEEHKIPNMLALAHRNLAASYLMQGNVREMQDHAIQAYNYFVDLNKHNAIEETRCLTGIAQAQENMSQYLRLVLEADYSCTTELNTLIDWKMLHIPFLPNMKFLHPEAKVNEDLKERMEKMREEEMAENQRKRLSDMKAMASTYNMGKFAPRRVRQSGSISSVSTGRSNFKRLVKSVSLLRSATGSIVASKPLMSNQ